MHFEISLATVATAHDMPPHDVARAAPAATFATTDPAADSNADPAGYAPQCLTLKGFRGIRDGLGRDEVTVDLGPFGPEVRLVAISGVNGRGKTTVMDNLHPYLVMPSRAGADGLGAFSYYDHLCLAESEKILEWCHLGRRYKTHLVFRLGARRRTEAFLFVEDDAQWIPVMLADGTPVDGKVDVYARAIEAVLGPADTFFTAAFSAQGKRALCAFRPAEIKSLLADLLGLDHVREEGARAADTARLLKAGLQVIRQEQAHVDGLVTNLTPQCVEEPEVTARVTSTGRAKQERAAALGAAQAALVRLEAQAATRQEVDQRRSALKTEQAQLVARGEAESQQFQGRSRRLDGQAQGLAKRVQARCLDHRRRVSVLAERHAALEATVEQGQRIRWAVCAVGRAEAMLERRTALAEAAQRRADEREALTRKRSLLTQELAAIEKEAGQVALRQADLTRRFGLTTRVPCAGLTLQGRCELLQDAREAQAVLPDADQQVDRLAEQRAATRHAVTAVDAGIDRLRAVPEARNRAEHREERARSRLTGLRLLAAREGEVAQAMAARLQIEAELAVLGREPVQETEDERAERDGLDTARAELERQIDGARAALAEATRRVADAVLALPPTIAADPLPAAVHAVREASAALDRAVEDEHAAIRMQEQQAALHRQLAEAVEQRCALMARATHVEEELVAWNLLARCLSHDGVIALEIDDAGPTLASYANDLLLACYGTRFTLSVATQSTTTKGELREDFDIVVHDGQSESKSLKLVSGGERTWINEALTRAIALYLAHNTGRRLATLFCDELDGALDIGNKRRFMAMKREVLRLGGYQREYFVSQTPELTQMADAVIDLDSLAIAR